MPGTLTKLILDLEALPRSQDRAVLLVKAANGHYHDFQTTIATPKLQLRADLLEAGFKDLAQNVVEGKYDKE